MKEVSKILLSKEEILVLREEAFFHVKRRVTDKIFNQLAETVKAIQSTSYFHKIIFPEGTDTTTGKISKGENYLGLPFITLDFPRFFSQEKFLTFRTMIWWGNFVSGTLLVSDAAVPSVKQKFQKNFPALKEEGTFLCVNESPWHHHFGKENFIPLTSLTLKEVELILTKQEFLKVAMKLPLTQINRLQKFSSQSFERFSRLLL